MTWRNRAACLGQPLHIFHPEQADMPIEAMRICKVCPVRTDCLNEALALAVEDRNYGMAPIETGIWGGTSSKARREIRHGRLSVARAFAQGDRIADMTTAEERQQAEEPWLNSKEA